MIFNMDPVCSVNTPVSYAAAPAHLCLEVVVKCYHLRERSHEWIRVKLFFQILKAFW